MHQDSGSLCACLEAPYTPQPLNPLTHQTLIKPRLSTPLSSNPPRPQNPQNPNNNPLEAEFLSNTATKHRKLNIIPPGFLG